MEYDVFWRPTLSAQTVDRFNSLSFEMGPIRPPSEAFSLLVRATRNCPWNRCEFCHTYKGERFELRPVPEIEKDIATAKAISDEIQGLSRRTAQREPLRHVAAAIYSSPRFNASVRSVALWLYGGAQSVFLQDANSLVMRTPDLVAVLQRLRETFPGLARITSYARSKTAARKSHEEMRDIATAGLSRVHIGLETGHTPLLACIQKGAAAEDHIQGGRRVAAAGISLSEYVMPGLGGKRFSRGHVEDTARVLNAIGPDFIRLRSLVVRQDMPLSARLAEGEFEPLSEDEVVAEIGELLQRLECRSQVKSDHVLNLLPEVEGQLPEDKPRMIGVIHSYLAMPAERRLQYRLGRRAGYYEKLADMADPARSDAVRSLLARLGDDGEAVEGAIQSLKTRFI
ncbi:MAG: radical SAM protein [Chloroflexi bacterium]|nr:radical SAM protein [Chloroflexota bacterium]